MLVTLFIGRFGLDLGLGSASGVRIGVRVCPGIRVWAGIKVGVRVCPGMRVWDRVRVGFGLGLGLVCVVVSFPLHRGKEFYQIESSVKINSR